MDTHALSSTLHDLVVLLDELVTVKDRPSLVTFLSNLQGRVSPGLPMLVAERGEDGRIDSVINVDWPTRWVSRYLAERYVEVDPVASAPPGMVIWSLLLKPTVGYTRQQLQFVLAARAHGMGAGLTWSVDFDRSRVFLSIAGEQIETDQQAQALLDALMPKLAVVIRRTLSQPRLTGLTDQQCMILHYMAAGFNDEETAEAIGLSPSTVTKKIVSIKALFGAKSRAQLMATLSGVAFPMPERRGINP